MIEQEENMMKRIIFFAMVLLMICQCAAFASVPYDKIENLSPEEKSELTQQAGEAMRWKRIDMDKSVYSEALGVDLMDWSIEDLSEMKDVLSGVRTAPPSAASPSPNPTAIPVKGGSGSSFDFPPTLCANYFLWAEMFSVPDFDKDVTTLGEDDHGENTMVVDNLMVTYDNSSFDTHSISFLYAYDGISPIDQAMYDLRSLALFSAIEIGYTDDFSVDQVNAAKAVAMPILESLRSAMTGYRDRIDEGGFFPFYITGKGTYYIVRIDDNNSAQYYIHIT